MNVRAVQIWGFLFNTLGWIFVACTMAMEFWKISAIGGQGGEAVVRVIWYWSSLWRTCFTDSTAVTNCVDFPVLWSVEGYIQLVRGLLMGALSVGILAFVLSLMGMECTHIGGKATVKRHLLLSGAVFHILSGILSFSGYFVYAYFVSAEYFNPLLIGLKFDLGTPLFLGWVGSVFEMTGAAFYCISFRKQPPKKSQPESTSNQLEKPSATEHQPKIVSPASSSKTDLPSNSRASSKSDLSSVLEPSIASELSSRSNWSSTSGPIRAGRSNGSGNRRNKTSYV